MWAMIAMATGAAPSAIASFSASYLAATKKPLDLLGLSNVGLFVLGLVLAAFATVLIGARGKGAKSLIATIRSRDAD
jgi:hypothetical protein